MKKAFSLPALLLLALVAWSGAVRAQDSSDWNKYSGLDGVYDMTPKPSTPAPKGYKAVYISHYGRHGSRYAYTPKTYNIPLELLRRGAVENNLTDRGKKLLSDMEEFLEKGQYTVGDLTPLGWEQHAWIARTMVRSFPSAFREGSRVDACSSASERSIMSMASECASFSREAPETRIYAHQGKLDIQATRPNMGVNPFKYKGPELPFPYSETSEQFFLRRFPDYGDALARIFKDTSVCLGDVSPYQLFFYYDMLVVGMNSLPEDDRLDVSGLITLDEQKILWETDNYERFREYRPYCTPCSSIVDDIIAKADARLAEGSTGADLRFGHDHVVMALLMIMDINEAATIPMEADDLSDWFRTYDSPMAANIQLVFYTPKKKGDVLVKLLLNGSEAAFGGLEAFNAPYYRWEDLKAYLRARTDLFVIRNK